MADADAKAWLAKALAHFLFGHDNLDECSAQERECALGWAKEWMEKPGNQPPEAMGAENARLPAIEAAVDAN